jgi:hypothetical protein
MSKKIFVLFIIGVILMGSGSSVLIYHLNIMEEKYPDVIIFFDGNLKQEQLSSTPIVFSQGDEIIITILSPNNQIFFSLTGPDSSTLEETVFFGSLSHHLVAETNGTYTIGVGNMKTDTAYVMGLISDQPFSDDELILSIGFSILGGSLLILIGVVIVIVFIIILVLKKIRSKNNSKKNSK